MERKNIKVPTTLHAVIQDIARKNNRTIVGQLTHDYLDTEMMPRREIRFDDKGKPYEVSIETEEDVIKIINGN